VGSGFGAVSGSAKVSPILLQDAVSWRGRAVCVELFWSFGSGLFDLAVECHSCFLAWKLARRPKNFQGAFFVSN